MTKPISRYARLEALERMLARQPDGYTTGELATALGVDTDTIRRDLAELEGWGTGLYKQGWRYRIDHRRSLHTVKMTNDEVMALFLATRLLSRHSDEHNPHVVHALEKLADALRAKSPQIAQHVDRAAAAVRGRRTRPAYVEALEAVTQGWVEQRAVWMRYRNASGQASERLLAPYYLEPSGIGYACYVIGLDTPIPTGDPPQQGQIKTFKIERIAEARITNARYAIPDDFDPQRLLANAWGVIWRDAGTIAVTLRFAPSVVQRVKESVWHHSQRLEDLPDGSCLFTVQVGSTLEMKPWIRQWGAAVEVVAPDDLRAELMVEVMAMAQTYGLPLGKEPQ